METTLKNYKSILSADLIKKAEQNIVRECDEVEKGSFVAYVDEKEKTYDTAIQINGRGEITGHSCDCKITTPFCRHKTALLLFVIKGKKVVRKVAVNRKITPLEKLVHESDPEKIKLWLLDLFEKNKELSITFSHHFSKDHEQYTPEQIQQLTLDAVKAVVKNRKNIDIGEVKKIVDLWSGLHKSIIANYCAQMTDEDQFLRLHAIIETCEEVQYRLNTNSNRFSKYKDGILEKVLMSLNQINDDEYWDQAIALFASRVIGEKYILRIYYLNLLLDLHQLSSLERKKHLAKILVMQYLTINPNNYYDGQKYTISIFSLISSSELFLEYYAFFEPIRYKNDFNIALIGQLIENNIFPLAEKYCLKQIEGNTNPEYNAPYFEFLIEIYTLEDEDKKLAWVYKQILPLTFDFNLYVFVYSQTEDTGEMKAFRDSMLARARRAAPHYYPALLFSFHLLEFEEEFSKMVNYLDSSVTYGIITRFANQIALVNKTGLIKQIISRSDNINEDFSIAGSEHLESVFYELLTILLEYFSAEELKQSVNDHSSKSRYYSVNRFVVYLNKILR